MPGSSKRAGPVFFEILLYEFLYTGMAQFIAGESVCWPPEPAGRCSGFSSAIAYAPQISTAALALPLILGTLLGFSGVLVPYQAIQAFWRYWLYYLNVSTLPKSQYCILNLLRHSRSLSSSVPYSGLCSGTNRSSAPPRNWLASTLRQTGPALNISPSTF